MARLTITYEHGITSALLTFRGEAYTLTLPPPVKGERKSLEPAFDYQYRHRHPNDPYLETVTALFRRLDDENEIEETLDELTLLEDIAI